MSITNHFVSVGDLQGKLLIASPKLKGTCFEKAVLYLCKHDDEGAMGLVLNHALPSNKTLEVLKHLNINDPTIENNSTPLPKLYLGGPVDIFRGFILHTDEYLSSGTQKLNNGFALSSCVDALRDIVLGSGPEHSIVTLGYAGWSSGQLEGEIADDSWLCANATKTLIFHPNNLTKWEEATKTLGVDMLHYADIVGHA